MGNAHSKLNRIVHDSKQLSECCNERLYRCHGPCWSLFRSDDLYCHTFGSKVLCEGCSVNEDGTPHCPRSQDYERCKYCWPTDHDSDSSESGSDSSESNSDSSHSGDEKEDDLQDCEGRCGLQYERGSIVTHAFGCVRTCEQCSTNEDGTQLCPKYHSNECCEYCWPEGREESK